jgi:hypothetical protein
VPTTGDPAIDALYRARAGNVDIIDVPELAFVVIDGVGAPEGDAFMCALQALYSVSYGAHFALRRTTGTAPRVMMLEALWWIEGEDAAAAMARLASGATVDDDQRERWCWRAMIMQLPPIDGAVIAGAVESAARTHPNGALTALRYERWAEGPSAQTLHVGPYSAEGPTIAALHHAIAERGSQPRGRHHEIYLGDPRTSSPDKLRTILRQPIT